MDTSWEGYAVALDYEYRVFSVWAYIETLQSYIYYELKGLTVSAIGSLAFFSVGWLAVGELELFYRAVWLQDFVKVLYKLPQQIMNSTLVLRLIRYLPILEMNF